ncbi:hypothetical protein AA13595_0876 [Gluconacetobacter johannae DSM 13595]|uniref:Uncharacterized protein n=1 Tax=Gluconacetobacter johannae TaxID=112140 RepID=A0A7W4J9H0_9PROT|nr:hypothetical protein [Gluconacetobacter johannae]MBB2177034.1 hypothetical protein [Gluconacetobacter johannae]GBQ82271.1 hypothetical protein AA13595_0876 [Gluconacetobacter johannae DSM 13595]
MSRKLPVATPDRIAAINQQTRDLAMLSVLIVSASRAALHDDRVRPEAYAMAMEWVGNEIESRLAVISEALS